MLVVVPIRGPHATWTSPRAFLARTFRNHVHDLSFATILRNARSARSSTSHPAVRRSTCTVPPAWERRNSLGTSKWSSSVATAWRIVGLVSHGACDVSPREFASGSGYVARGNEMGLLTIIKKVKAKEREMRLLMVCVSVGMALETKARGGSANDAC